MSVTSHSKFPARIKRRASSQIGLSVVALLLLLFMTACDRQQTSDEPSVATTEAEYDLLIRNGLIHDGLGGDPYTADLAITGDRIAAIGKLANSRAENTIDASSMVVAPGFINMLSWAPVSLIEDPLSQSDIRQGVTLEIFGEGQSMGPWNDQMKAEVIRRQGDIRYEIHWTTLGEYLDYMASSGVSPNIASFVGATTVRIHELGQEDREPSSDELERMKQLVATAMEEGALGLGSSLIYAPAFFADTAELIELSRVAARYDGVYISHLRSEGNKLVEAVDELITIARESGIRAEIYHLKAAGKSNWRKLETVIERVEAARAEGLAITADMYTYTAGATGLDAAMPPWVQEGGYDAWAERLKDPEIRKRVAEEMITPTDAWESLYLAAGSADKVILSGFRNDALKHYTGRTLAEVAADRGQTPEMTAMDLVVEDGSRVGAVYFLMTEENIATKIRQPWMSFGSDAESMAPEGTFLKSNPHPRAYGNFARLLGHYVREKKVIDLAEAIRRITDLPATNLKLKHRGRLAEGYFADVVVFDQAKFTDHATFSEPHQYATGMIHVWVNGVQVLANGKHTGQTPGRVVRGPGWRADQPQ